MQPSLSRVIRIIVAAVIILSLGRAEQGAGQRNSPRAPDKTSAAALGSRVPGALTKRIPDLMRQGEVPGLAIAIVHNAQTYWLRSFGVKNAADGQAVTEDTTFEAASLSKPVFAYAVLKLVDEGKLDLDTPLTNYLPKQYIDGDDRLSKITARYVLSHRTGFPNWRGDGNALTIRFTPGERFSYSGEGFVYLQRVVEHLTGKPLNDFMTETVFAPLGMTSSSYVWRADYDARTASGHDADGNVLEKWKPKEAVSASSLQTTAKDYALFVDAVLHGMGLKPRTLKEMETPQVAVDPTCTNCLDHTPKELSKTVFWGLGWGIERTDQGDALWHWGDNGAFKCYVVVFPKRKIGVVMFTNSENGLSIAKELVKQAIGTDQPAFHWLKYDAYDSPAMQFARGVHEKGAAEAIEEFQSALKSGTISEDSINSAGYRLLRQKKVADAIQLFQLNVNLHPTSSNVYDSLGEAYMDQGDKNLAVANYEKSLQLNPQNNNAVERLKKLRE